MEESLPIKQVIASGNELIGEISRHPAILKDAIAKKKTNPEEMMDVDLLVSGDLLDQIDVTNKLVAEIDDNIRNIFKSVRAIYSLRFPELKVNDPMQYIMTAQLLGNKPSKIGEESIRKRLSEILDPKMYLLVSMTAATTQGIKIEPDVMEQLLTACAVAGHLSHLRAKLIGFVELHMGTIAPNLSVIVGAPIAAKLVGLAGGLNQLANMPACNVPILGSHKVSNIETNISAPPRVGVIYDCDLIQQIPFDNDKDLRKRAVRWVANKCVLAARCDVNKSDHEGRAGAAFRNQIETLISKELEPPPKKAPRPLPIPIEKSGKKRGGKRVKRMKERYAQTELRKAANRINFGDVGDEAYQDDLSLGRSQLNAIKKLRGPQVSDKTRIRLSKSAQKKLAAQNKSSAQVLGTGIPGASSTNSNGTTKAVSERTGTQITLKPQQQGLEIFNPKAVESYTAGTSGESSNYFSNTSNFFCFQKQEN